jgi:ribosomal protein S18 acetylase RimI-like enzyme
VAHIRPIDAEDKDRLTRFHGRLSDETRYRRYHAAKGGLSRRELVYLTEVDGREHVAVVALCANGEMGAVARVVSNGDGTAEVAVVVADDCRGLGLGAGVVREAIDLYAESALDDVAVFANVQSDNAAAMTLFRERLGGRPVRYEDGVAIIQVPLAA